MNKIDLRGKKITDAGIINSLIKANNEGVPVGGNMFIVTREQLKDLEKMDTYIVTTVHGVPVFVREENK